MKLIHFKRVIQDFSAIEAVTYASVLGFVWYYEGIKKLGPSKASLFINFVPISVIILAFLFLDEPITISLLAGAAMVSLGVYLTNTGSLFHLRYLRFWPLV